MASPYVRRANLSQTGGDGDKVVQGLDGKIDSTWGGDPDTLATLDSGGNVEQDPASASLTAGDSKIPLADGDGKIDLDFLEQNGTGEAVVLGTGPAFVGKSDSGQETFSRGDEDGKSCINFGVNATEGAHIKVIEQTVSLAAAGAKFVAMTTPVPSGAVILAVQANIEALAVAGGTSVKVALGLHAGDVDKYGKTGNLTKNQKINTIPDWAVLSGNEQIDVCAVLTDGSDLGDSDFTAGSVRVRIVYLQLANLANAA